MKTNTILAAALAALVALPVAAQTVSPGEAQMAAKVGVEPGLYSMAQLVQLAEAQRDSDASARTTIAYILANPQGELASVSRNATDDGVVTPGEAQLALSQGVEPGEYSVSELILIDQASSSTEDSTFREAVLNREITTQASGRGTVTAGKEQLAASLGVDAADYTAAELSAMYADKIMD